MRTYPVCVLIFSFLVVGDLLLLVVRNGFTILLPTCTSNGKYVSATLSNPNNSSNITLGGLVTHPPQESVVSPLSSFDSCSSRVRASAVFAVHSLLLVLEMVAVVIALLSTFWGENMLFRRILHLLKYNFPFWLLHFLLTTGAFVYAILMMSVFEGHLLCFSDSVCLSSISWVFYLGYGVFQVADIVMWMFTVFFSMFIFGILSAKTLYAPFSMHCGRKLSSFYSCYPLE